MLLADFLRMAMDMRRVRCLQPAAAHGGHTYIRLYVSFHSGEPMASARSSDNPLKLCHYWQCQCQTVSFARSACRSAWFRESCGSCHHGRAVVSHHGHSPAPDGVARGARMHAARRGCAPRSPPWNCNGNCKPRPRPRQQAS